MTTHSSVLAWGIPLTEKCGGLQSIGLQSRTRLSACVRMRMPKCSVTSNSSATPWTVVHQTPLSMGLSRQEYWSELPFPTSGGFPNPGTEPTSLVSPALAGRDFTISTSPGSPALPTKLCKL